MKWLKESNRMKHFYCGIPTGLLTIIFTLGIAFGMEIKDKLRGQEFDWLDIAATMLGGLIGQIIQILIILLFI